MRPSSRAAPVTGAARHGRVSRGAAGAAKEGVAVAWRGWAWRGVAVRCRPGRVRGHGRRHRKADGAFEASLTWPTGHTARAGIAQPSMVIAGKYFHATVVAARRCVAR